MNEGKEKRKEGKSGKQKPAYGMFDNTAFMIRQAWEECPSVLWLGILQAVLAVLANLLGLYVTPTLLTIVEIGESLRVLLTAIGAFAAAMMLTGAAIAYLDMNVLFGRIQVRTRLVVMLQDKFGTTSYPNTGDQQVLKLLDKASMTVSSNSKPGEAIWGTLEKLLENIAGFSIYMLLLSSLDLYIAAITLATTVLGYFAGKRIQSWGYFHREEEAGYWHKIEYVSKHGRERTVAKDIRIFNMQPWLAKLFRQNLDSLRRFHVREQKVYLWANVIDAVLGLLRGGIAYAYLIYMTLKEGWSASTFLLYFTAINGFTTWVSGILTQFTTLHQQSLDLCSVREYLDMAEAFRFEDGEPLPFDGGKSCEIELRDVSFRYPGADQNTLEHINLTLHSGEKLAVVGRNGAGKTTLVKLLCGFYDPTEGQVLLNGQDIRRYNRRDYYRQFSAVFQNFSIIPGTVALNVAQDRQHVDEEKVKRCIATAGLQKKIESLPDGIHTCLGREVYEDAVELSGGEMQRLMLARALYKDGAVIVLDEPTAALDPIAESDIYRKYNDLCAGKSSIFISHRLASTSFCDRILLVDGKGIAEEGTHEELLDRGGVYYKLFEIQSKYYQEGEMQDGCQTEE